MLLAQCMLTGQVRACRTTVTLWDDLFHTGRPTSSLSPHRHILPPCQIFAESNVLNHPESPCHGQSLHNLGKELPSASRAIFLEGPLKSSVESDCLSAKPTTRTAKRRGVENIQFSQVRRWCASESSPSCVAQLCSESRHRLAFPPSLIQLLSTMIILPPLPRFLMISASKSGWLRSTTRS